MLYPEAPYAKKEVTARNGIVAACDSRAADWGLEVLKKGGNAADAAVVTGFLMMVYEPFSCGLGGHGGHMAFYDAKSNTVIGIDASSKAPAKATADMFMDEIESIPDRYGDVDRVVVKRNANALGFRAMFAPTTVAQYTYVLEHFGTMTLEQALEPAIKVAEEGFIADSIYTTRMNKTLDELIADGDPNLIGPFKETFFPNGSPLKVGDLIVQKDMAHTMRRLAKEGPELFYGGEVSDQIVSWVQKHGGILTEEDFTSYKVEAGPMSITQYRGYDVYGYVNSANGGTIGEILNLLDEVDLRSMGYLSTEMVHTIIESMKLAFTDRYAYIADRDHVPVPYDGLISKSYAKARAKDLDTTAAQIYSAGKAWDYQVSGKKVYEDLGVDVLGLTGGLLAPDADNDTTFMVAADKDRNIMMITSSNFSNCKVVVPGLGFQLNNSMSGANPVPGHALSIAPFKRILRNSGPTLVFEDGLPKIVLSAPGGRRIITGTVTNLINSIDFGMSTQGSLDAPRIHCEARDYDVILEDGISQEVRDELTAMGHNLNVTEMYQYGYSRMQMLEMDFVSGLYFGGSEPRSHSGVRGY